MSLKNRIQEGLEGKFTGLNNGFDRINDYIFGVQRKSITLIGGQSGTFKTTLLDFIILNALEDAEQKNIPFTLIYNSFEIDKLTKQCNWLSVHIFKKYGVIVSPEKIKGFGNNRLTAEEQILVNNEIEYVESLFNKIKWNFHSINPTGLYKQCWDLMLTKGKLIKEPYIDSEGKQEERIVSFQANNPDEYVGMVTDHLALISKERGYSTKENIDKYSEYEINLKNLFGMFFIDLQQFNQSISSVERAKFKGVDLSPQQSDYKDSTNPYQNSDLVLGIMAPFKLDMSTCLGYDINILKSKMIMLKIIKNRMSKDNIAIGLLALPEYGSFKELPKVGTPELQIIYDSIV